ncbi:hypothetical protein PSTT_00460 [Puccinia striiformis]|uniref:Dcp1p-Dcp2p decapping enzyme complex alpha subunit n=1 Tax=Puccinia striiformis TaxID=27350 RepID=A0A2S4W714_9BASI|nr:hypothetical protein PSTT_00460 [Puccinia striiformis]
MNRSDSDKSLEERFKPDSIDNMATPEEVQAQIAAAMAQMSVKFEEKLLEQDNQILSQQREILDFKQQSAHNRQQPPHQQQQQFPAPYQHLRSEAKIRQFNGAVQKTHADRNTDHTSLLYDGSNYQTWEKEINRTLGFVFDTPKPFLSSDDNFSMRAVDEESSISALLRLTIHKDLRAIVDGNSEQSALDLFKLIKLNCSHSNRQYKLKIVDQMLSLAGSKSPGSELTLAKWTKVFTDIEQLKIPTTKLCGLILQNSFNAPTGVDKKTFDFSIDGKLEAQDNPNFADVTTVIRIACGKGKAKSFQTSTDSYAPMDLDAINAVGNQSKYLPPAKREPAQKGPALSYEKALFWKGHPTPESLRAKYGDECHRCGSIEHWYNNCTIYWEDVKSGLIPPPPENWKSPQSTYRPPRKEFPSHNKSGQQSRLRQLDVPTATDGKFLLDRERQLIFKGTIKIPTSKGTITVDEVYYCPGVDGVILSVGRLTECGWQLNFKDDKATLISPQNVTFSTTYRNHCWYIAMCKDVMNKITHKSSLDPFLWHR